MKGFKFIILFTLLSLASGHAEDENLDHLATGNEEFEFNRFTAEYIQLKIQEQVRVSCRKNMCTMFATSTKGHRFTTQFMVGEGNPMNGGLGGTGNGGVVIVPGGGVGGIEAGPYIGLTVQYSYSTCTEKIKVPEPLFVAMSSFMYHFVNEDGTPRRGFTPADEAMILFYSTIMKQANGCKDGNS